MPLCLEQGRCLLSGLSGLHPKFRNLRRQLSSTSLEDISTLLAVSPSYQSSPRSASKQCPSVVTATPAETLVRSSSGNSQTFSRSCSIGSPPPRAARARSGTSRLPATLRARATPSVLSSPHRVSLDHPGASARVEPRHLQRHQRPRLSRATRVRPLRHARIPHRRRASRAPDRDPRQRGREQPAGAPHARRGCARAR